MKRIMFACEFHPGMNRVEFHPGMKFNLKENIPLSMMKTYNNIYHFFSITEIRSLILLKTSDDYFVRKARYMKWLRGTRKIFISIYIIYIIINIIVSY